MYKHDNILIKIFWDKEKNQGTKMYRRFNQKSSKYINILNYLKTRFKDSESFHESLLRIVYNIEERPICPICGNKLKFIGKPNNKGIYRKTCSKKCSNKLTNNFNKHIQLSQEKAKQTKLKKYGNLNNFEKVKQTKLKKYGDEFYTNIEKSEKTKLEKYGDEHYNNREKFHKTCLTKYGIKTFVNVEKAKKTKLEKYGDENYINSDKIKLAYQNKTNEEKQEIVNKVKKTKQERYGNENYNNIEKYKQTCLEKYGVSSYSKTNKFKYGINWDNVVSKQIETKKKNKTLNTSKTEIISYNLLKTKFKNVKYQYKSEQYPFACDFYIPELNLFIECNYHWTHGGHPFNENNLEDQKKLKEWKIKNTEYYNNAINTWVIRDVYKRNIAKKNNLNYLEFWSLNEFKKWITNQS